MKTLIATALVALAAAPAAIGAKPLKPSYLLPSYVERHLVGTEFVKPIQLAYQGRPLKVSAARCVGLGKHTQYGFHAFRCALQTAEAGARVAAITTWKTPSTGWNASSLAGDTFRYTVS